MLKAWRRVCGPIGLFTPARRATRRTIRWRSGGPSVGHRPAGRSTRPGRPDSQVDGAGGARGERDDDGLAAFAILHHRHIRPVLVRDWSRAMDGILATISESGNTFHPGERDATRVIRPDGAKLG